MAWTRLSNSWTYQPEYLGTANVNTRSSNPPLILAFWFLMAAIVYYLMPLRLKFFGDTAGILTRKPIA